LMAENELARFVIKIPRRSLTFSGACARSTVRDLSASGYSRRDVDDGRDVDRSDDR
jgi:hypothetical protein